MSRSAIVLLAFLAKSGTALAQATPARQWEIGARVGGGPSIVTQAYGGVPDGDLLMASVYVTRAVVRWKGFAAGYFAELTPLVVMTKVPGTSGISWDSSAVAGVGLQPVGVRFSQQIGGSVLAFAEAAGGGAGFTRAVPRPDARALNVLASGGGGIRIGKRAGRAYLLGYRFTHLSNAYTAPNNPGYNAHIFYLGVTFR
jgi:hypothetical protein